MRSPRIASALVFTLVATSWLACSQSEGEPCQSDGDCDDGLFCVRAQRSERGTCKVPSDIGGMEDAGPDAGAEPPLTPDEDAGEPPPDGGASTDGSTSGDASMAPDAAVDGGPDAGDGAAPSDEDAGG